jgi:putative restriction endonuclease
VQFVVLLSKPESPYADTQTSYEYPAQYRQFFEPLERGEPMLAIIYEPLARGRGRMAYVGWAALTSAPTPSPRKTDAGRSLWEVRYVDRAQEFPSPVPRDIMGEPIEGWLRLVDPAHRSVRTSGASVRTITFEDARRILELGHAGELPAVEYAASDAHEDSSSLVAERATRLVIAVERDAVFRRRVMAEYNYKCSVSGFGIGDLPLGRATRLLDAAHIRPVAHDGSDAVSNGLALTPTLHRLFDQGFFTIRRSGESLQVVTSPILEPTMITAPDDSFRLPLRDGLEVRAPNSTSALPSLEQLRFHQRRIFKGPESALDA